MIKTVAFIFFTSLISTITFGQNLVPNGSFEKLRNLPVKPNPRKHFQFERYSGFRPYKSNLNDWIAASETTPDLRMKDPDNLKICQSRFDECDEPRTGDNCVGIITYQDNEKTDTYREYIQVKLKDPLRQGVRTFVEFWVAKERQAKLVSNNIGCYFSKNKISAGPAEVILVNPVINDSSLVNFDRKEWVKIEGEFTAEDASRYLTIGNFFKNKDTKVQKYDAYAGATWTPPYAYYLIDDVRVWQEGDKKEAILDPVVISKPTINQPFVIQDLQFDFDEWTITNTGSLKLQKVLDYVKQKDRLCIFISGHTDSKGSLAYNLTLSEKRAKSVADFFISAGIDEDRLSWKGYGDTRPLVAANSASSEQRNRRVEITLRKK